MSEQPDIEDLVKQLDAKYGEGRWLIWRTSRLDWAIQPPRGPNGRPMHDLITNPTLTGCMADAVAFKLLPKFRRRPMVFRREQFEVRRSGSRWAIDYDGEHWAGGVLTKSHGNECIDDQVKRTEEAAEYWDRDVQPLIANKVEGVDFVYVD